MTVAAVVGIVVVKMTGCEELPYDSDETTSCQDSSDSELTVDEIEYNETVVRGAKWKAALKYMKGDEESGLLKQVIF